MTEIGKNIKALRMKLGLTQEELAAKVGYKTKSAINKIELGVNDLPQKKIVVFADALDTTPAALMGWSEETYNALSDLAHEMYKKEPAENDGLTSLQKEAVELIKSMSNDELMTFIGVAKTILKKS